MKTITPPTTTLTQTLTMAVKESHPRHLNMAQAFLCLYSVEQCKGISAQGMLFLVDLPHHTDRSGNKVWLMPDGSTVILLVVGVLLSGTPDDAHLWMGRV